MDFTCPDASAALSWSTVKLGTCLAMRVRASARRVPGGMVIEEDLGGNGPFASTSIASSKVEFFRNTT